MKQKITIEKKDDWYYMRFEGNDNEYPVRENAIKTLDEDIKQKLDNQEKIEFIGEYKKPHKHQETFQIEKIIENEEQQKQQKEQKENQEIINLTEMPVEEDEYDNIDEIYEDPSNPDGETYKYQLRTDNENGRGNTTLRKTYIDSEEMKEKAVERAKTNQG